MLRGGDKLYEHACKKLGIGHKEVTADGQFSLEEVECIGACSWAPAMQVNYDFHHFVTPEKAGPDARRPEGTIRRMLYNERSPLEDQVLAPLRRAEFGVHRHLSANDGYQAFLKAAKA
jgi:hypothetical protein